MHQEKLLVNKDEGQCLLESWDPDPLPVGIKCSHCSRPVYEYSKRRRWHFLFVGLALLCAVVAGALWYGKTWERPAITATSLDFYFELDKFTTTWTLEGDEGSGAATAEAADLWQDILDTDGIVSLPHTWAAQHGLPPTDSHPERPDHALYQVDAWHSLHCLFRIRNRIASHVSLNEHPRDDKHTLHCIDYIRQQLLCHADLTLQEGLTNRKVPNQCRDFGTVQGWVRQHGWPGYRAYMAPIMEAEVQRQMEEEMERAGRNQTSS